MANRSSCDEVTKQKALAIAETVTVREAAEQTGVPEGTIKRWRFELRTERGEQPNRANRTPKNLQPIAEAAVARAVEEAGDYIADRLRRMADDLYSLAEQAVGKVRVAIADPDEVEKGQRTEPHDRDGAAWVRALVGVLAQSLEKAQLLTGKPTARPEVVQRHEYDITQRIISDPEALQLAEQLLVRAALSDTRTLRLDGQ